MARIRSIHPGFFTDEAFVSVPPLARILFIGLLCEADDSGVFEWKPVTLKMRIVPADDGNPVDMLAALEAVGIVRQFEADGRRYGALRNFGRYQRPRTPIYKHPCPPEIATYTARDGHGENGTVLHLPKDPTSAERKRKSRARHALAVTGGVTSGSGHGSTVTVSANRGNRPAYGVGEEEEESSLRSDSIDESSLRSASSSPPPIEPEPIEYPDDPRPYVPPPRTVAAFEVDPFDGLDSVAPAAVPSEPDPEPQPEEAPRKRLSKAARVTKEMLEDAIGAYVGAVQSGRFRHASLMKAPPGQLIQPSREKHLRARLAEWGLDGWMEMLDRIEHSAFLQGDVPGRRNKLDIDWLIKPDTIAKILEGKYDGTKAGQATGARQSVGTRVADEIRRLHDPSDDGGATGPHGAWGGPHVEVPPRRGAEPRGAEVSGREGWRNGPIIEHDAND